MLIVNPFSGRGLSNSALGIIVSMFCEEGYAVKVFTTHLGTPEFLAEEYSKDFDLVVCVGGDGTLSGVASGLMRIPSPPPFGLIPAGTANDVASSLALPKDPRAAVRAVLKGRPVPLDIGRMGERYFTYVAAFGAFTGVSYKTKQSAKRSLGHLAYVLDGLASMQQIAPRHTIVEYDGGVIEGDFIFGGVTNSTSIAGFVRLGAGEVDLGDGLFEVILVKNPVTAADFGDIIGSILKQCACSDNIQLLHTQSVRFRFDEDVEWTLDGENGGVHRSVEVENCRHALRIML